MLRHSEDMSKICALPGVLPAKSCGWPKPSSASRHSFAATGASSSDYRLGANHRRVIRSSLVRVW